MRRKMGYSYWTWWIIPHCPFDRLSRRCCVHPGLSFPLCMPNIPLRHYPRVQEADWAPHALSSASAHQLWRGWKRKELPDGPASVGQPRRHRWCPLPVALRLLPATAITWLC